MKDYLGKPLNIGDTVVVVKKTTGSTNLHTASFAKAEVSSFKKSLIVIRFIESGGFCREVGKLLQIDPAKTLKIERQ